MVARGRASVKMYKEKSKTILKNHPFISKVRLCVVLCDANAVSELLLL